MHAARDTDVPCAARASSSAPARRSTRASRSTAPADARVARGASPRAAPAPRERERASTARRDDSSSDARDAYSASLRARAEAAKRVGRTRGEASSERVAMTMGADGTAPRFYEARRRRANRDARDGTWRVDARRRARCARREAKRVRVRDGGARRGRSRAEWEAQGERVAPFTMPLTSLSATAIDHMGDAETRRVHVETLLKHFGTDASAGAEPGRGDGGEAERGRTIDDRGVGGRESSGRRRRRIRSSGRETSEKTVEALRRRLHAMCAWELTCAFALSAATKSLLIGLKALRGGLTVDEAIAAARVEEEAQIEEWGLVEGGHDLDQLDIRVKVAAPVVLMKLRRDRGKE